MRVLPEPIASIPASAEFAPYLRVKITAGVIALAGAADQDIGTLNKRHLSTGLGSSADAAVVLSNAQGVVKMIAAGAITIYARVYGAASGKVSATANGNFIGYAMTATTADGDEIEVFRTRAVPLVSTVEAKTANYTVTVEDSGKTFTTVGAAGTVVFAMPAAVVGLKYRFRVGAAQELRIDPNGTETIALPSTGVQGAAGKYLTADADGETVDVECTKAAQWSVFGFTGTWTAEV
jgi:hypothetical protein